MMFGGPPNFLAYYLSAGVLASYGSLIARNLGSRAMMMPSLGASGAILFLASTVAFRKPNMEFGLIFLPGVSFPAETMIMLVMCADVAGLLLGWRTFDKVLVLLRALMKRLPCSVAISLILMLMLLLISVPHGYF